MTSREIYKRFLLKINKNDSNDGVNVLPSHFVLMFNTESLAWLGTKLRDDSDNWKLDHLQELVSTDVQLPVQKTHNDSVDFTLPGDLYRYISSYSIASQDKCKGRKIFNFDKNTLNLTAVLADAMSRPSFKFEETPCIQKSGTLKVYFEDFKIDSVFLSYYRQPKPIDIAGYRKLDGSPSVDADTDLSDENIDEVLNRMAVEVLREYQDGEGFQLAKDRIASEP